VPVPQKWIGSSVALGFDCGSLPRRDEPEESIRKRVLVSIFDWGRSELNTVDKNVDLTAEEQADRLAFWRHYVHGIDRLAWETARIHWQRFRNTTGWKEIIFDVYDFDSATQNDFIGQARLQLPAKTGEIVLGLKSHSKNGPAGHTGAVTGADGVSTITVSVEWRDFSEKSRLKGAWRVSLIKAANLPGLDKLQFLRTSDPFVLVQAVSEDGSFHSCQQSVVVKEDVHPSWDEVFELSVMRPSAKNPLHRLLGASTPAASEPAETELFPPQPNFGGSDESDDAAFSLWTKAVSQRRRSFGLTADSPGAARKTTAAHSLKRFHDSVVGAITTSIENITSPGPGEKEKFKEVGPDA